MKKFLSIFIAGLMLFTLAFSFSTIAKANGNGNGNGNGNENSVKVRICHRTNSVTNPYTDPTVDADSVDGDSGNDQGQGDHLLHVGPVFDPNSVYPTPHNGDQWGDIIPPFDINGQPYDNPQTSLNWPAGQTIWENDCNVPGETPEFKALSVKADCSGPEGLTRWEIDNPNNVDISFTWELYLVGGSPVKESGSGQVSADSSITIETHTSGDVRLTVYWCDPTKLPGECDTLHVCATNEDVRACSTPTSSGVGGGSGGGKGKTKISPQVLGTTAPTPTPSQESLPVSGADVSYAWVYYFLIIGSLMMTYYLKIRGWKSIKA